ncbi:MAG: radical SAM protein [Pseudomonadota bacterium]
MRRLPIMDTLRARAGDLIRSSLESERLPAEWRSQARRALQTAKDAAQSFQWPRRPQLINIEITAICDARCIHCPREAMDRSQRPMEMPLFKKLIDQAAELGVPDLSPNGFGEILTMRSFDEHFAYVRSKSHRFRILVNSNGFRLDDDKIESFLRHEVDFLNITLDGATAETFEKIRVRLKLDQIEDNIMRLIRARDERGLKYPKVRVGMIAIPQNMHEIDALLAKWKDVVDFVGVGGFTNRAGSLDEKGTFAGAHPEQQATSTQAIEVAKARPCVLPFRDMNVWADGKAVLCCDDWNEEHVVGDLNTQSLSEIWNGPALHHARSRHMAGCGNELEICGKCNMWREASGARLWS